MVTIVREQFYALMPQRRVAVVAVDRCTPPYLGWTDFRSPTRYGWYKDYHFLRIGGTPFQQSVRSWCEEELSC